MINTVDLRLRTALHVARGPSLACRFRVIARLMDGATALVCLTSNRQEAEARARTTRDFSPDAIELRLEQWIGPAAAGSWHDCGFLRRVALRRNRRLQRRRP